MYRRNVYYLQSVAIPEFYIHCLQSRNKILHCRIVCYRAHVYLIKDECLSTVDHDTNNQNYKLKRISISTTWICNGKTWVGVFYAYLKRYSSLGLRLVIAYLKGIVRTFSKQLSYVVTLKLFGKVFISKQEPRLHSWYIDWPRAGRTRAGFRVPVGSRIFNSAWHLDRLWDPPSILCSG
jgi:hypothetical protein